MSRRVAFLFPGQGMEEPAQAIRGTGELQPMLVAVSLRAAAQLAAAGIRADVVAGHSVGELAAWCAAGAVVANAAIEVAARRGALMAREAALHPGAMLALLDADEAAARAALELGRAHGEVALACVNAPRQHVLSGDRAALSAVARTHASRRLAVAGAWHSEAMRGALDELRALVRSVPRAPMTAPLVCNRTGRVVERGDDLPDLIAEQLVEPVQWLETMTTLRALAVTDYVTVGPGRVLRALVRADLGAVRVHTTEDAADLARTVEALRS